jgi:hypothetical protein
LKEVKKEKEMKFVVVGNPRVILTSNYVEYLPIEIEEQLENFADIVVDELPHSLPPIRSINHHIDLIPGTTLPNKATYRLTPRENEEVKIKFNSCLIKV